MATVAQSPTTIRPPTLTAASTLLALMGLAGIVFAPLASSEADAVFLAITATISALRVVAAVGVWRCRRWAAILGFVVSLVDTLLAAPGLFSAPNVMWQVLATIAVLAGIATMALLVLPESRRAYA